jgi:hypothetical protein
MEVLVQQIINGLVLGSMYALIALGYTMVYGIINLINFAHGEVLMVGALTSWTIIVWMQEAMPGTPGWLILLISLLIAFVVCGALNFAIEKIAYRPLRNSPKLAPLITAIGMSILLQTLAMMIWKPNYKAFPTLLPAEPLRVESLTQALCDLAMSFGEGAEEAEDAKRDGEKKKAKMSRPFGVSLLIAGADARGPQLFHMDPSGTYIAYAAHAIGAGAEGAVTQLVDKYTKTLTLEQATALVTRVLSVRGARAARGAQRGRRGRQLKSARRRCVVWLRELGW